jgi:hypothetical protein
MIRRLLGRLFPNPPVEVLLGVDWDEPADQALWLAHGGRTTSERDEIAELERAYRRASATERS